MPQKSESPWSKKKGLACIRPYYCVLVLRLRTSPGRYRFLPYSEKACPETHTKRQATQHGFLPSLLGDGDCNSVRWGKKHFVLGRLEQPSTKEWPLSFVGTLWVPIHLSFNSQQGSPLCSLSGHAYRTLTSSRQENPGRPCARRPGQTAWPRYLATGSAPPVWLIHRQTGRPIA